MNAPQTETLPSFLRNAGLFLWGYVLPQLVLLVLNLRGWWLIAEDVDASQQATALLVFAAEILILGLNLGLFVFFKRSKRSPDWRTGLALLLLHVLYMWFGGQAVAGIVPANVAPWIISGFDFFVWNLTFYMPGAFLSLYLLACAPLGLSPKKDALYTLGALLAAPLVWYFAISAMQPLLLGRYREAAVIFLGILCLVLLLAALARLLGLVVGQARDKSDGTHYLAVFAFGLLAPLGGLYLNSFVPFPADFQAAEVYVLAVLNGLLLFPRPGGPYAGLRLFSRALAYPFILYFFLVFLPFLPLALFAVVLAGAGFLMLTPVALGVFQTGVLLEDFRTVCAVSGKKAALALTLAGLSVLPGYFALNSLRENVALNQAVDFIYTADPRAEPPSPAQAQRAARAVLQLRARKKGLQLPYLSGFYNHIVFGDMDLPDSKIERMYRLLTGSPLPALKRDPLGFSQRNRWAGGRVVSPERDAVKLVSASVTPRAPGRAGVRLLMRNRADTTHAEYLARIKLPEGVFPTGLRLKIGDGFVPGKLFERKAAMWVYQKITEVRRDPALLVYRSPDTLELRVYPFPAQGEREAEIEFAFPAGAKAGIDLDGQRLVLAPDAEGTPFYSAGESVALLGNSALPAVEREPYLHFVLDFSANGADPAKYYPPRIAAISAALGISRIRLSAANLRDERLGGGALLDAADSEKIRALLAHAALPRAGGFWAERALRKELLRHAESVAQGDFQSVPVFVLVSPAKLDDQERAALPFPTLAFATPDMDAWYLDEGGELAQYSFAGDLAEQVTAPLPAPAYVLGRGGVNALFSPRHPALAVLPGNGPLEYFDGQRRTFTGLPGREVSNPGADWENRARLWRQWREASLLPSRLEQQRAPLLEASRASATLLPSTAFIVVENTAQWRILERKEAKSLANRNALEFEEQKTPEPPAWLLFLVVLGLIWASRRRAKG